jgi:hypothetical protein
MSRNTHESHRPAVQLKSRRSPKCTKSLSRIERWDSLHPDYCDAYAVIARQMTVLGFEDEDIRNVIGITQPTFESWELLHPAFKEALSQTADQSLASLLMILIKQAVGYSYETEHIHDLPGSSIPIVEYRTRYRRPSRKALYMLMRYWPSDGVAEVKSKDLKVPPSMIEVHNEHEEQRRSFKRQVQEIQRQAKIRQATGCAT